MYLNRNLPFEVVCRFGWLNIVYFFLYAVMVAMLHHYLHVNYNFEMHVPFSLIGPVGVAVAIFTSFKNSQSYDRMWEARKNWGALSGQTKIFANQVMMYVYNQKSTDAVQLLKRQIALLRAHKLQLRTPAPHSKQYRGSTAKYFFGPVTFDDWNKEVATYITTDEFNLIQKKKNKAYQLIRQQNEQIKHLYESEVLSEFKMIEMIKTLDNCIENMGRNERIKTTPFPRQYAFFSRSFVIIFILLLPFGFMNLYSRFSLATYITICILFVLVAWLYITMELIGDYSEDPFENFATDIPLNTICANTEFDLSEIIEGIVSPQVPLPKDGIIM